MKLWNLFQNFQDQNFSVCELSQLKTNLSLGKGANIFPTKRWHQCSEEVILVMITLTNMINHIMPSNCNSKESIESVNRDGHIITTETKFIFKASKRKHGKCHIQCGICFSAMETILKDRESCMLAQPEDCACTINSQSAYEEKQLTNGKDFGHN